MKHLDPLAAVYSVVQYDRDDRLFRLVGITSHNPNIDGLNEVRANISPAISRIILRKVTLHSPTGETAVSSWQVAVDPATAVRCGVMKWHRPVSWSESSVRLIGNEFELSLKQSRQDSNLQEC